MSRRRGLTLVEVMTVMAVASVLAAFVIPAISSAREAAKRTACIANLRSLGQAWTAYAMDNHGSMVNSNTGEKWGGWVKSGNGISAITDGALFNYCSSGAAYRCPGDQNQYLRSYSISCQLNGEPQKGMPAVLTSIAQVRRPEKTLLMIEEWDPRNYNIGSFIIKPTGDTWVDFPARWHFDGVCLSYVDGHAEYMKYQDRRTCMINWFYTKTPKNPDLKRLQSLIPPNNF